MTDRSTLLAIFGLTSLLSLSAAGQSLQGRTLASATTSRQVALPSGKRLMYTTYFYTAKEAVIHGYQDNTRVRIVSLDKGGTVWRGVVARGQVKLIPTGAGAFAFVADKKASILVGTPSFCTAVGYWVRDRDGSFRSDYLLSQLPSSLSARTARVILWSWDDTAVSVYDRTSQREIFKGRLQQNGYHTLDSNILRALSSHLLEFRADKPALSVQIYYDEGFFVPADNGRASGRFFQTFVGSITNGANDLTLINQHGNDHVKVSVTDLQSEALVWHGRIAPGRSHTLTLSDRYLRVTSDEDISVSVAPIKHYRGLYAEHHFSAGRDGAGIDTDHYLTTTHELWLFSYYDHNRIRVIDVATGKQIYRGKLGAGQAAAIHPGQGIYRVYAEKGISTMGGGAVCGAEYSPAGSLFAIDEALLKVVMQIKAQRRQQAISRGHTLSNTELNAPLRGDELRRAVRAVKASPVNATLTPSEAAERLKKMSTY